ncbi:hypothetical protein GGS21DRAFT_356927 [Xylaria nigripes]|nr:hypothetical protein GGS21DRAFT_356927 [Xylaria nigripes]
MAHYMESAPSIPSSALDLCSSSDILGDTKLPRSLVKISSAQRALLSRPGSWESLLSRRPNGFVNVPPDVLEQLKASYTRQKRTATSPKCAHSKTHDGDIIHVPEPSSSQSSPSRGVERDGEDGCDYDDSHNRTRSLSWSLSPSNHLRPPGTQSNQPTQLFMTQLPEGSQSQPTVLTTPVAGQLSKISQSSQDPEDELEVEVPAALAHNPIPINKSALAVLTTPPSAQIPCTFEQSTQSDSITASVTLDQQPRPQPRQAIDKGLPRLYQSARQDTILPDMKATDNAVKPVFDPKKGVTTESSSSADNLPLSIIPSTMMTDQELDNEDMLSRDNPLNPRDHQGHIPDRPPSRIYMPPPPSDVTSSHQLPTSITRPVSPPVGESTSREVSFAHYTATYPSYQGSVQDFIMACSYIQGQRHRIRTSLYDDFIRAWVEGYLPYVEQCDSEHPSRQALEAIEWYNEIDDDPIFTSRVVTRRNLASMLDSYPNETRTVQTYISILIGQTPNEHVLSRKQAKPNVLENETLKLKQRQDGKEPARESVGIHSKVSRSSPSSNPAKSPFSDSSHRPVRELPSGKDILQTQPSAVARSPSETHSRKRSGDNELSSERSKRIAREPTPDIHYSKSFAPGSTINGPSSWSGSIANGSVIPESTARRHGTKDTEDQEEKRKRRLAKHFKKCMARQKS